MSAGIYKIENLIDANIYIGSTNNFKMRFKTHKSKLNLNNHPNIHLQRAWNLYKEQNFKFEEIIECEKDQLSLKEQHYLDLLYRGFNKSR